MSVLRIWLHPFRPKFCSQSFFWNCLIAATMSVWNVEVRNTFVHIAHPCRMSVLRRSESVPAMHLFFESAPADDAVFTRSSVDDFEKPSTYFSEQSSMASVETASADDAISTKSSMDASENSSTSFPGQVNASVPCYGGKCTPCSYFAQNRCRFAETCTYCHVHPWQQRPNKKTRARRKGSGVLLYWVWRMVGLALWGSTGPSQSPRM